MALPGIEPRCTRHRILSPACLTNFTIGPFVDKVRFELTTSPSVVGYSLQLSYLSICAFGRTQTYNRSLRRGMNYSFVLRKHLVSVEGFEPSLFPAFLAICSYHLLSDSALSITRSVYQFHHTNICTSGGIRTLKNSVSKTVSCANLHKSPRHIAQLRKAEALISNAYTSIPLAGEAYPGRFTFQLRHRSDSN